MKVKWLGVLRLYGMFHWLTAVWIGFYAYHFWLPEGWWLEWWAWPLRITSFTVAIVTVATSVVCFAITTEGH